MSGWMADAANKYQLHMLNESPKFYMTEFIDGMTFKEYIEMKFLEAAENASIIVVGMGAQIIFRDHPDAFRVRIIASDKDRITRIQKKYGLTEGEAHTLMQQSDKKHRKYLFTLYNTEWDDFQYYDLVINTEKLTIDQCAEMIASLVEAKKLKASVNTVTASKSISPPVKFKHPAEEEFANILDMYGIEWQYEPRTFPVQWDAEGNVTMAFSPDFYLTKFDTYIEITTMDQKYVTTKNKKVKRLRELYPGININIVYKKDFHTLLKRFGFSGEDEINEFNRG
jgi:cytidylate kinase